MVQGNYRFFFAFISTSTILCVYVFTFSWIHIIRRHGKVLEAMKVDYLSDFLIVYCFIAVWFVGGLTAFHHLVSMKKPNETAVIRVLRGVEEPEFSIILRPVAKLDM